MGWQDRDYHREGDSGRPQIQFRFPSLTPLLITLMCVNLFMFLLKISNRAYYEVVEWGELVFTRSEHWAQMWRWISYQYLHADGGHLFFNMLTLYFFLPDVEKLWGWQKTLVFYTLGGIASGVCFLVMILVTGNWPYSLIGASGSVLAMVGAVALLKPDIRIFGIIPIRVFVLLLALLYLLTVVGDRDFSNAAHLGGLAFGFFTPLLGGSFLENQQLRWKRAQKEKAAQAVVNEQAAVDGILAKVAEKGMNSLTSGERKMLARATENQQKRDRDREKKLRDSW